LLRCLLNGRSGHTYAEPYAGGAGAALALLYAGHVDRIVLNDADRCVFLFWKSVLEHNAAFLRLIEKVPLTIKEWKRQRAIYQSPARHSTLAVGFATFYLNRCNRSGIIASGGPIGGVDQRGEWKIDARFNREELARRVEKIEIYRHRIAIHNLDAVTFLRRRVLGTSLATNSFVYLDPPYYAKGKALYLNCYTARGHQRLASFVKDTCTFRWAMTYDNVPEIRRLYTGLRQINFDLGYSAHECRVGKELLIVRDDLTIPAAWQRRIPKRFISAASGWNAP